MRLKGKTALVTGSTSGIGLGIAKAFAADGANIIINGFGEADAIETERKGLEAISGGKAAYDGADLTKPEQIEGMFAQAEKDFGGVDILVNNAGMQFVSPVEDFPVEKWDMIIALNLTAAFHTIRHAVPGMRKKKWGRIIGTASASPKPLMMMSAPSAAKAFAMPSPMPEVDPVTRAVFPLRRIWGSFRWGEILNRRPCRVSASARPIARRSCPSGPRRCFRRADGRPSSPLRPHRGRAPS